MKPKDWNHMTIQQKKEWAIDLFKSTRGYFVIGQALAIATQELKKNKYPEQSNIEDMEIFGENLFNLGYSITNYFLSHNPKIKEGKDGI